mmetsp:Transcript_17373/g.50730  ORF Transcript_17373/g.50730 Transcript_17373/m.50730 type:complete len:203 (+) Transcript_17373:441-1049(+)
MPSVLSVWGTLREWRSPGATSTSCSTSSPPDSSDSISQRSDRSIPLASSSCWMISATRRRASWHLRASARSRCWSWKDRCRCTASLRRAACFVSSRRRCSACRPSPALPDGISTSSGAVRPARSLPNPAPSWNPIFCRSLNPTLSLPILRSRPSSRFSAMSAESLFGGGGGGGRGRFFLRVSDSLERDSPALAADSRKAALM